MKFIYLSEDQIDQYAEKKSKKFFAIKKRQKGYIKTTKTMIHFY